MLCFFQTSVKGRIYHTNVGPQVGSPEIQGLGAIHT
jgi:hypothetical protein